MISTKPPKESTTLLIRRRLHHWRTTVAGIVTILAPVALILWPEHAVKITAAAFAFCGGGLTAAADSKNTDKSPVE